MVKSETKEVVDFVDNLLGTKHNRTTITDDNGRQYSGAGNTAEEAERNASRIYQENSSSHSSDDSSNGSSGGLCYLTAACTGARGLPDNCHELTVLRGFRDDTLAKQEGGLELIAQYYQIAPQIIEKINVLSNKDQIYQRIYAELVLPCVLMIEQGKNDEAKKHYIGFTQKLAETFLQ